MRGRGLKRVQAPAIIFDCGGRDVAVVSQSYLEVQCANYELRMRELR